MALVDRAQRIITAPAAEWPVIATEPATVGALYSGYIVPLALIAPICSFVSSAIFLHRPGGIVAAAVIAVMSFVLELVNVFIVALIAEALAPSFNGVKDRIQALKWVSYSYTAKWVSGIALLIPIAGALIALIGGLYSLYTLYLGAVPMIKVPQEKAVGYVVVVILVAIVIAVIITFIVGIVFAMMAAGAIMSTGGIH